MKKTLWIGAAMVAFFACMVGAAERQDRPAGVAEKDWIHISERFGFVVENTTVWPLANSSRQVLIAPPETVSAEHMPPAKGYFVVKTSAGWRRVTIAEY